MEKDIQKRADHIYDFVQELKKNKEELARITTKEMERPLKKPNLKERCAWVVEYFADNGNPMRTSKLLSSFARKFFVSTLVIGPAIPRFV